MRVKIEQVRERKFMRLSEEGLIRVLSEISFTSFSLSNNARKSDDVCCVLALSEG